MSRLWRPAHTRTGAPRTPLSPSATRLTIWLLRVAIIAAFLGAWQAAIGLGWADPILVGDPAGTFSAFLEQLTSPVITHDLPFTIFEALVGFAISVTTGFLAGVGLSQSKYLRDALSPLITALNSLPRIALAPLFILWFGLGAEGKIALVVSFVFFVMLATTIAGLTQPNADFELLARSLGVSRRQAIQYFVLPAAVPTLAAGLELSVVYSFLGAVSGELIGGARGLGVRLVTYANNFQINDFMAILLILVIVSVVPVQLLRMAIAPFIKWHRAESGPA